MSYLVLTSSLHSSRAFPKCAVTWLITSAVAITELVTVAMTTSSKQHFDVISPQMTRQHPAAHFIC